jgi:hypothetical protein
VIRWARAARTRSPGSATYVCGEPVNRTTVGAPPDAKISARSTHTGLAGRTLKTAGPYRVLIRHRKAHEQLSETEAVIIVGDHVVRFSTETTCIGSRKAKPHNPRLATPQSVGLGNNSQKTIGN